MRDDPIAALDAVSLASLRSRSARQKQREIEEQRRQKHLPVAGALRDPTQAPAIISAAQRQVVLWRRNNLCSSDYIEAWETLLADPAGAANLLEEQSPRAQQLRQNSPFVGTLRQFRSIEN